MKVWLLKKLLVGVIGPVHLERKVRYYLNGYYLNDVYMTILYKYSLYMSNRVTIFHKKIM